MSGLDFLAGLRESLGVGGATPPVVEPQAPAQDNLAAQVGCEAARRPGRPKVQRFDLSGEPHELDPREWNSRVRRDPTKMLGAVMHQWDTDVGTTAANRRKYGNEAAALAHRGLAVPYTLVAGVTARSGEPVAALVHPLERYTFASDNASGHYVAIGVMGTFPYEEARRTQRHTPLTAALAAAVDECLAWVVELLDAHRGADAGPLNLITHRQACNGPRDHFNCPGEAVVGMACASEWVRLGAYRPLPDAVLVEGVGKPWPEAWRRHLPSYVDGGTPAQRADFHPGEFGGAARNV